MHLHRAVCVSQNAAVGAHFDPDAVHLHGHIAEIFPERNLPCLTTALTHDPRSFSTVVNDSSPAATLADTPQRRGVALAVVELVPVAEALIPRTVVVVLRGRPVPTGGIRTSFVKSTDGGAVLEQHVQFTLRRRVPVLVAVCVEIWGVLLRLLKRVGQRSVCWRCIHRFVRVR